MAYVAKKLEMGWITVVITIASIVIPLIMKGIASQDAINMAKAQLNLKRSLYEQEKLELARLLHNRFTNVSIEDFRVSINLAEKMPLPDGKIPNGTPKPEQNYWIYLAIFVGLLLLTQRRRE
jgi:hypothetical protein